MSKTTHSLCRNGSRLFVARSYPPTFARARTCGGTIGSEIADMEHSVIPTFAGSMGCPQRQRAKLHLYFGMHTGMHPHVNPVWKYVQACTCNWARSRGVPIIWLQSVCTVPPNFAGCYGSEEALQKVQGKWRDSRKRKGILGVLGFWNGMRYRVIDRQIRYFRDHGVHTAATAVLRGINLHPEDEGRE